MDHPCELETESSSGSGSHQILDVAGTPGTGRAAAGRGVLLRDRRLLRPNIWLPTILKAASGWSI